MNAKVKRQHENSNENCIPHVEGQSGDLEDIKKEPNLIFRDEIYNSND